MDLEKELNFLEKFLKSDGQLSHLVDSFIAHTRKAVSKGPVVVRLDRSPPTIHFDNVEIRSAEAENLIKHLCDPNLTEHLHNLALKVDENHSHVMLYLRFHPKNLAHKRRARSSSPSLRNWSEVALPSDRQPDSQMDVYAAVDKLDASLQKAKVQADEELKVAIRNFPAMESEWDLGHFDHCQENLLSLLRQTHEPSHKKLLSRLYLVFLELNVGHIAKAIASVYRAHFHGTALYQEQYLSQSDIWKRTEFGLKHIRTLQEVTHKEIITPERLLLYQHQVHQLQVEMTLCFINVVPLYADVYNIFKNASQMSSFSEMFVFAHLGHGVSVKAAWHNLTQLEQLSQRQMRMPQFVIGEPQMYLLPIRMHLLHQIRHHLEAWSPPEHHVSNYHFYDLRTTSRKHQAKSIAHNIHKTVANVATAADQSSRFALSDLARPVTPPATSKTALPPSASSALSPPSQKARPLPTFHVNLEIEIPRCTVNSPEIHAHATRSPASDDKASRLDNPQRKKSNI